jgi:3-oxoacyl-[acyl-carrier protein] reductase
VVKALTSAGASVAVLDRDEGAARSSAERAGTRARAFTVDVRDAESVSRAEGAIREGLGPATVLVQCAGIGGPFQSLEEVTDAEMREVIETNLVGALLVARAFVGGMRERGWGRIVNLASLMGSVGAARSSVYAASKHGVVGLTRSWARELGEAGITVNAVAPGFVDTPMGVQDEANPGQEERVKRALAVPRLARPAEVARLVLYLCGPDAGYLTGAVLPLDGGITAGPDL